MARKSKSPAVSSAPKKRARALKQSVIPEPFQMVRASLVRVGTKTVKVPELVLRGEWLRKCGFPIDSAAFLTPDRLGEMTLHRLGLSVPRRIKIRAAKV